jgi:putative phage-type endonuclease
MEIHAPRVFNGAMLLGNYIAGSPMWHAERQNGVGGSEVGTILGLNAYESAYALWAKKSGLIPSEVKENWAMRFGKAFEEPILRLWQEEHPEWKLYTTGTYQDMNCEYRHANPDALAHNEATDEWMIIEVKTARNSWDEVPPAYIAQVLHYMGVMKVARGLIVAVAGMTWNEYEVPFNAEMIETQNTAIDNFWDCVQTGRKPAWDGSESTYNAVRIQNPLIQDTEVELGELGYELLDAQTAVDQATYKLNLLKSMVLDNMGLARWATVNNQGETRRVASRQIRAGNPSLIINKKGI